MAIRKKPSEKILVDFVFDKQLTDSDSITAGTVMVKDSFGTSYPTMVGTVFVNPTHISAVVQGGTVNVNYIAEAVATTTLGRMYEIEGIIKVRELVK